MKIVDVNHHFEFVQFPFNLFENNAFTFKNNENFTKNIIDFAKENKLVTVANRPLNSYLGGKLFRLAEYDVPDGISLFKY